MQDWWREKDYIGLVKEDVIKKMDDRMYYIRELDFGSWSAGKLFIFICITLCLLLSGCSGNNHDKNNEIVVQSDVEFVQTKLPNIEEIKSVKYYYHKIGGDKEIGLERIEFVGFIEIGDDFLAKIEKEYKWKETEKVTPKIDFSEETEGKYKFLYCDEFNNDGKYKSHSSTGSFYLDSAHKLFYFELEYS